MTESTDLASRTFLIDQMIAAGGDFYSFGWAPGVTGSFSSRVGENSLVITVDNCPKRALTHEFFVDIDLDGQPLDKESASPSADLSVHLAIYKNAPQARAIFHIHHLSASLCSDRDKKAGFTHFHELEILRHLGVDDPEAQVNIPVVSKHQDRDKLAKKLVEALNKEDLLIPCVNITNHGLYVWGTTVEEARQNLESCAYLFDYSRIRPMHPAKSGAVSGFQI